MNSLTPIPQEQIDRFRADLEQAAVEVCQEHGMDPRECIAEAVACSGVGRFSISYNYWNLPGCGGRGSYLAVVAPRSEDPANGGVCPLIQQRAKFSSAREAVAAWCVNRRSA